ncbi:9523_t:CDS:2, partial [Diversispora eburnea]
SLEKVEKRLEQVNQKLESVFIEISFIKGYIFKFTNENNEEKKN